MEQNKMVIRHLSDIPPGGFAGIVEKRMVMSPVIWPDVGDRNDISQGLGDFIYLATGHFKANDGAPMHPHKNVDIITLVLSGTIAHAGTLGDGTIINGPGVQVQRAGTGMQHSEFNPENKKANFVQMWFNPPEKGLQPAYQNISMEENGLITVLGGNDDTCFSNNMTCQVGFIRPGENIICDQPYIAFVFAGNGLANGQTVNEGDLIEGDGLQLVPTSRLGLALIQATKAL